MASRPVVDIASGYPLQQWEALTKAIMQAISNNQLRKRNGDLSGSDSGPSISSNEHARFAHFQSDSASLSGDTKSEENSDSNYEIADSLTSDNNDLPGKFVNSFIIFLWSFCILFIKFNARSRSL